MPNIQLREITEHNLLPVLRLKVAEGQEKFVATNAVSIAQAHYSTVAWFRAIYADDTPVGFIMLEDNEQKQEYCLWRLMIDGAHQGKGYGKRAVELLIDYVRTRPGARELLVSCVPGEGSPIPFYEGLGFVDQHRVEDGEHVYALKL